MPRGGAATERITVGIGELKAVRGEGILAASAIGSCIALCLYDPALRSGAMCHILLPKRPTMNARRVNARPDAFYADSGAAAALELLLRGGSRRERVVSAIIGGAAMYTFGAETLNIGRQNSDAAFCALEALGIPPAYTDVGGNLARSVEFTVPGGGFAEQLSVRTYQGQIGSKIYY